MGEKYKAFVEADCIIVPRKEFDSVEEAEEYLENNVDTGELGPVNVRGIETTDS